MRDAVFFDVTLAPHRSLPRRGFVAVMVALGALSVGASTGFALAGAWPVGGFFGLDVLLLYVALRASYRSARQRERVRLTRERLEVERVDQRGGRSAWQFQPFWLRVVLEERPPGGNRLILSSHGRSLVLGSFLGPAERRSLALGLREALARWRRA
jgi:uncharacterized membrane protein